MNIPVEPGRFALFLGVMATLAATPGPANLYSIATGLHKGPKAALLGVAGMNAATLVWFIAAALGLGALEAAFPEVFRFLTLGGALYVAWLGLKSLLAALKGSSLADALEERPGSPFLRGFAVQIANPKAVLFFSAVLPPFLDLSRPLPPQLVVFACATLSMDVVSMSIYGLGGAFLSSRLSQPGFRRGFNLFVGAILLFAAYLILSRH
jgi:threonine/homoserine/homoserine lactone efflux protein